MNILELCKNEFSDIWYEYYAYLLSVKYDPNVTNKVNLYYIRESLSDLSFNIESSDIELLKSTTVGHVISACHIISYLFRKSKQKLTSLHLNNKSIALLEVLGIIDNNRLHFNILNKIYYKILSDSKNKINVLSDKIINYLHTEQCNSKNTCPASCSCGRLLDLNTSILWEANLLINNIITMFEFYTKDLRLDNLSFRLYHINKALYIKLNKITSLSNVIRYHADKYKDELVIMNRIDNELWDILYKIEYFKKIVNRKINTNNIEGD